jgi:hypothetical protein
VKIVRVRNRIHRSIYATFDLRAHQGKFSMDRRKFLADRMLEETTVELAKFCEVMRSIIRRKQDLSEQIGRQPSQSEKAGIK